MVVRLKNNSANLAQASGISDSTANRARHVLAAPGVVGRQSGHGGGCRLSRDA